MGGIFLFATHNCFFFLVFFSHFHYLVNGRKVKHTRREAGEQREGEGNSETVKQRVRMLAQNTAGDDAS